jgi:uncharacterized membrane protein
MSTKTVLVLIAIILLVSAVIGMVVYPQLPQQVASHWNAQGQPDDTMSRFWGVAIFPIAALGMSLILMLIPLIDPLRKNIVLFRQAYDMFILVFNLYFFYIYILTLAWNLGYRFDFTIALIPAMAVLFYLLGVLLGKSKRNWFIGMRTPWTLSSDQVWEKTHQRGALLFKIAAGLSLLSLLFPSQFVWFLLVPILAVVFYLVVYSYILYKRETESFSRP